ncbi:MAG: hypothetical protein L0Y58_18540 [Verrucomicrobia subdivision 3 bacterium]|nr:hypothetical protein [Limisphaerales bacterium]
MNNVLKPSARRAFLVVAHVACLCLVGGVGRSSAGPTDLSIPGTVTVKIEPVEAVTDGARWSVDGGPLRASGESVANLAAGAHTVQFSNLAAWLEPESVDVLVIGGKEASVIATYRSLPRFYFRATPEQRVRVGTALELLVQTDDPGDPQNPGPGTALQMTATPPPAGALTFDQASGRITYTPSPADRLPFTVRLATPQGLAGTFEVTPLDTLAAEQSVIEYDRPLPDAESRDYIQISEVPHAPELFNDATAETFTVSISGHTLVFAEGHPASLHRQNSGRANVRELRLYADTVIIRSPLLLPQTAVTIRARELRFEGDGRIETTPRPRARRPAGAVWEDDLLAGNDGDPGHPAGNADVFVERFYSDESAMTRFVLRGGGGGPAGEGRDGRGEGTVNFLSGDWNKLMTRAGNPVCGTTEDSGVILFSEDLVQGRPPQTCGARVTARGENAVPSGRPGNGGTGGTLRSTLNLGAFGNLAGGNAGAQGNNHVGGTLTARRFLYVSTITINRNGEEITSTEEEDAPKAPGNDAAAPSGQGGAAGAFVPEPNPGTWLHSFALRSIVQYAKDAYLNDRIAETRRLLGEYRELLRAHDRSIAPDVELSDEEFSEKVNLDQLQTEVGNILYRIDSNLDYFGNPAGWVPMLSFEANFLAFQNEVDQSLPILYLAYWLNNAATNLQASLAATEQARSGLEEERARMDVSFNEAQSAVPRLKSEAESIAFQIGALQGQITNKLSQLEQRARDNVSDRHKLPFWKKALGVLSVVADLVPVGQPTVGRIGAGLGLLRQVDPEKPIESAKALQPQAFSVMTNIDISLCFGSNATNSPGSTNNVKKARQEQLKRLTECGKFLASEYKEISAVFKEAQVDDKEVAAELEKLKAADTEIEGLTQQVTALNAEKERFANELAAGLQVIGSFTSGLSQNLVATHELEDRITANINILDHGTLMHIKEMERRATDRLVQYQYMLAKSFQYRQLRPYPGTLRLTRLLTRFRQLIEANTSHLLTQAEFQNLRGIFVDELREVVAQSLDNINAPARSFPKSYRLNADQRQQLNQKGQVVLSLKELGLIDAGDDNVRLADLRTRTLTAHPVGPVGSLALVRVNFEHRGVSRLTSGGRTFLFRHYQTESVNPIVWNAIFDANTGQTVNSTLSAAQQSLISVLLSQQPVPVTNLVYFSQPAADAEILLTKDVSTDNGTDFTIDDLLFEVQYDFSPTSDNLRELNVRVSDDLTPVIVVSQQDINSRQDGLGDFSRVFPPSTLLTLQAPPTHGRFVFDRWFLNNQPQTRNSPAVSVFLSGDAQVEARYRLAADPPVLTLVTMQPGQIAFSFPSEPDTSYTVEQSPRLTNPVWTTVETRVGDGATIRFTRPVGAASTIFFRVRQEP